MSKQIHNHDIYEAAQRGISLIINNRPDGEDFGQPSNGILESIAKEKGIDWLWIPVESGQIYETDIEAILKGFDSDSGNILLFCRSGTRSSLLWAFASAKTGNKTTQEILEMTEAAGHDFSAYKDLFDQVRGE